MNYVNVTKLRLNVQEISDLVASDNCGAISMFIGTTRDNFEGKSVVKLEYEVYESMALKCMNKICEDLRRRFNSIENIAVYHRFGEVPVKEASVIIAISAPHRCDSLEATQVCIDEVKKSVPIWKKEVYKDGLKEWKENKEFKMYPPRIRHFKLADVRPAVESTFVPPHLIQVKSQTSEIDQRIKKFMERKRLELNESNIRDFCPKAEETNSCARADAKFVKRDDSKGHLYVNRSLNEYYRDQPNLQYMKAYEKSGDGLEERLQNVETQLGLKNPMHKENFRRIKAIEDRLLHLETISPEYTQFFARGVLSQNASKKRVFSASEIESMITHLETKKLKT